ncbi:hypothetical protein LTR36_000651 [Oleoguttula mirabilis]|uniref:Protein sip5 n=1 Tax=Oleoguttula mirabilis TaxID=1507867 RepID=A0AAV9JQ18_9PEZI|nr:hypothetical protein LTR36_000651 [Oleoguttula mirabilis]
MGNSSSKDERERERRPSRPGGLRQVSSHTAPGLPSPTSQQASTDRITTHIYGTRSGSGRGSRHDISFLSLGRDRGEDAAPERPRETKQEKEARRAERERQTRLKERERSMREEGVDGGYLVTLGTYTGAEDFDKVIVRQLQIERRLAPFWKGLNDHSDSWTEAQLVAAVRGLPIPAADEVPLDMARTTSQASLNSRGLDVITSNLMVPISSRSQSYQSDTSANLSASHPAFSNSGFSSPTNTSALLRGRAKTLASLATGSKSHSPDMTPKEIQLPKEPYVNGLPVEAYLYREAPECPICFMYYPPYLNKTRCCDQPICSECFVQIKRPDPHPPEHEQPGQPRAPEEEADLLVSEVAACPFCVTPEFGVTYDPPTFRRGLAYPNSHSFKYLNSAMSSSSSLQSGSGVRRRATSLSANAPQVVTTDKVRPDWAKKLSDARAHTLRRSAAATALHNAAYVLGNQGDGQVRGALSSFGRRRRTLFGDSPSASGSGTPRLPEGMTVAAYASLFECARADREPQDGSSDMYPARSSSRRTRVDDLEDLMMMEAIRLSLAAEDDRKRREDKDAKREEKKKAKEDKKQAKKEEKLTKKRGGSNASLYPVGTNDSTSTWASTSMGRSTSNLGTTPAIPEEQFQGKGKAPVQDFAGFNPMSEPTSTLNTEMQNRRRDQSSSPSPSGLPQTPTHNPQGHLEASRANLQPTASSPIPTPSPRSPHFRQLSNASSAASSFVDSAPGSLRADSTLPFGAGSNTDVTAGAQDDSPSLGTTPSATPGLEPMFNFRSLAAMIGNEDKARESEHIEHAEPASKAEEELKEPSPTGSPRVAPAASVEGNRSRGDSGESSVSVPPPIYVEHPPTPGSERDIDQITPVPAQMIHDPDKKYGDLNVLNHPHVHETTQ